MNIPFTAVLGVFITMHFLLEISHANDVVHLKSGETVVGTIDLVTDHHIRMNVPIEKGTVRGSGYRSFQSDAVDWIEFAPTVLEKRLLKEPLQEEDLPRVRHQVSQQLSRVVHTRSRIGELVIAWIQLLVDLNRRDELAEHIRWLSVVADRDWDEDRRERARYLRWRALIILDRPDAVADAVTKWLTQPLTDAQSIEGHDIFAEVSVSQFRRLVKENPRWPEDPETVEERARLYHQVLAGWLYPFLFHGSSTQASANALWKLAVFCDEADELHDAKHYCEEIIHFFSDTEPASKAKQLLQTLSSHP